jgi:hypothetical protein
MADTAGTAAILVCHDARAAHWQLGSLPPRDGAFALIGWTIDDADGGIPVRVVHTLARALVRYGRVTFACDAIARPASAGWHERDEDYIGIFKIKEPRAPRARLGNLFRSSQIPLLSTAREEMAHLLFDDAVYQWWNQSQFALLSTSPASAPNFPALPGDLFEPDWTDTLSDLKESGVDAVLRPGVDGDVAGLLASSNQVRAEIEEAIQRAAGDLGLAFHVVPEQEFAVSLLTAVDESGDAQ